jgi:hypothetical protein
LARPTSKQSRLRFERRSRVKLEALCQTPTIRDALKAIEQDVEARWKAGLPFATEPPMRGRVTPEPCWYEHWQCRQAGVLVGIEDRGRELPMIYLSLSIKAEIEDLAVRLVFPQDLLREQEYDLWEIRRDAPLSRVIEDLTVQWEDLQKQREKRRARFSARRSRGPSSARQALGLEAYRRRLAGQTWEEISRVLERSSSTLRSAVNDLCDATSLPHPIRGNSIPDLPIVDCDNCPRRRSPIHPCADCPVAAHLKRYLPDND